MTAPRDPIEAPATQSQATSPPPGCDHSAWGTIGHCPYCGAINDMISRNEARRVEAAARDEGRREAVRLREALERLVEHHAEAECYQYPRCENETTTARRALDDVARHGRSSDPEPAPEDVCPDCHMTASEIGQFHINAQRAAPNIKQPVYGAVPALQATGEPTDE